MKRRAVAVLAMLAVATPALAGYKLMPAGQVQPVGKLGLSVTPGNDWNRLGAKLGRNAESWTLDGDTLNDLTFYAGIEPGRAIFREVDKRNKPLPKFSASMLPPDLVQLFEGTYRVAAGTSLFTIDKVEPATLGGKPGVHFTYSFALQDEEVKRNGEGTAAVINGKLYMITFEAPVILYFDRDIAKARAVVASARIG